MEKSEMNEKWVIKLSAKQEKELLKMLNKPQPPGKIKRRKNDLERMT